MSELPEDLLEEILCRVPVTSLKRLRSTCKQWNRLFNNRRFARKHFDKAAKQLLFVVLKESRVGSITRTNLHRFSLEVVGELSLTYLHSSLDQVDIRRVSHCDGLFLCVTKNKKHNTRLMVWNPCTRQTRWILTYALGSHQEKKSNSISYKILSHMKDCNDDNELLDLYQDCATYALGSYQDKKSNDISYKISSHNSLYGKYQEFRIYEINSKSWRTIDVTIDFRFKFAKSTKYWGVSSKGKTYWIAEDEKEGHVDKLLLVSFDYTTERFERLCLPGQYSSYRNHSSLSIVTEERLSMLLQRDRTSKTEIWVTNKIGGETKVVSWSMVYAVDLGLALVTIYGVSFWIDEEKRVLVFCDNCLYNGKTRVHIVGENNKVKQVDFVVGSSWPFLFNYVPSLIQI